MIIIPAAILRNLQSNTLSSIGQGVECGLYPELKHEDWMLHMSQPRNGKNFGTKNLIILFEKLGQIMNPMEIMRGACNFRNF